MRKYYPPDSDEPHYDLTPATEKAIEWLASLRQRLFVATESRLLTVFELLRQIVEGSEPDRAARLAELERRKAQIEEEIRRVAGGDVVLMDETQVKDRFLQMATTARALLTDFREVEQNFRKLDRGVREQIALWDGAKGELLERIFGERDAISDSDQGRSFRALLHEGYGQHVTLAQVFWIKDAEGQPARLFVLADEALTIREHFSGFGSEIADLRKRLRKRPLVEPFDSFPPYAAGFRRRFGINNDQALELRGCREALRPWFAEHKYDLLQTRLANLAEETVRLGAVVENLESQLREQRAARDELKGAISRNGGDRLEWIRGEISRKNDQRRLLLPVDDN